MYNVKNNKHKNVFLIKMKSKGSKEYLDNLSIEYSPGDTLLHIIHIGIKSGGEKELAD